MGKTSKLATQHVGARRFKDFVQWCTSTKGVCTETDVMGFICDTYKREYVIRYAAADSARAAKRYCKTPENNAGVRFLQGTHITEQEAERLYTRGICRLFNDLRCTCRTRSKTVTYDPATKMFSVLLAKDCDESSCK